MKIVFTWDDGALEDLKLIKLHNKYKIPGLFFVPTFNCEGRKTISEADIKTCQSDLISFGGHTQNHVFLTNINIDQVESEIYKNKEYLESVLGDEVNHFCLPGGKYNSEILKIVFKYFKTCRTADTMNCKRSQNLIKPTFHFYVRGKVSLLGNSVRNKNFSLFFKTIRYFYMDYFEIIKKIISTGNEKDIFIFWGHSWELEKNNLWEELEALFAYISKYYFSSIVSYDSLFE